MSSGDADDRPVPLPAPPPSPLVLTHGDFSQRPRLPNGFDKSMHYIDSLANFRFALMKA